MRDSQFGLSYYENTPTSDVVKEWVMHFHKILQKKTVEKDKHYKDE